jgi:hypothetical protein
MRSSTPMPILQQKRSARMFRVLAQQDDNKRAYERKRGGKCAGVDQRENVRMRAGEGGGGRGGEQEAPSASL